MRHAISCVHLALMQDFINIAFIHNFLEKSAAQSGVTGIMAFDDQDLIL